MCIRDRCGALPVLPLRFLRVPNSTAAGGLISSPFLPAASLSSLAITPAFLGLHRFPSSRLGPVGPGIKIHISRRGIIQRLVWTLLIVPVKPTTQSASRVQSTTVILQVNVLIFDTPPPVSYTHLLPGISYLVLPPWTSSRRLWAGAASGGGVCRTPVRAAAGRYA